MAVAVCQVLNPGFPFCAGGGCQTINNRLPCRVETAVIQDALFGQFFPVDTGGGFKGQDQPATVRAQRYRLQVVLRMSDLDGSPAFAVPAPHLE